jgi:ferritin-like metal-binding protein YciE
MADPTTRELKLIQYLNEAYGKERELETALQAHIKMTTRDAYKKRLQAHLKETKGHARDVKARIKKLGGTAEETSVPGPEVVKEVATGAQAVASKAVALAQGPLHALRGTSEQEKQLKNAKTEYASEAEEIAMYTAIEALADALSDDETVKLARRIRRDEERMGTYLEKLIPSLTKAVVQEEIPASERKPADQRRSAASSRARSNGGRRRTTASRSSNSTSRSSSATSRSSSATSRSASATSRAGAGRSPRAKAKTA